tara:strand:+ start:671 stop:1435 length:765 start_codon:yes stop_codon:yes gene_type:complete
MILLKKKLGQHFLHDNNTIDKIIRNIGPTTNDYFIEIGPGDGAITIPLSNKVKYLTVIEKDARLIPKIMEKLPRNSPVKTINQDILKYNFQGNRRNNLRLVGNLPYNISTEIIFKILDIASKIKDIHFMMQKEVVDRMIAKPGSKEYGRLSVMAQIYFSTKKLFDISPNVFFPKPKVMSSYIRLIPNSFPFDDKQHEERFKNIVTAAFTGRRKMVKTSLKKFLDEISLRKLSIDPTIRPEMISTKNFLKISKLV